MNNFKSSIRRILVFASHPESLRLWQEAMGVGGHFRFVRAVFALRCRMEDLENHFPGTELQCGAVGPAQPSGCFISKEGDTNNPYVAAQNPTTRHGEETEESRF
jgi:hypothetical protein